MNSDPIKCSYCGRFISYQDIDVGRAVINFTPDNAFGPEEIEYWHKECDNRAELKDLTSILWSDKINQ